ncbi:hypothetical protein F5883DRAFT_506119 [Diaporthe sp. PMI_573]|nr:hypothetical protein F5883DRAFT_506119 [Diaporthaceae sp. PMI_573]
MDVGYHTVKPYPSVLRNLIANAVIIFLAWVVVVLRLVSRRMSGAGFGRDDWLVVIAVPQGLGMLVISTVFAIYGEGYNLTEVVGNVSLYLQLLVAHVCLFALATLTIKFSVLSFYLRIFVNRFMIRAVKAVMVFVALWSVGNILQVFLICRPFASSYDLSISATCGDQRASLIAIACFNAITDVTIWCLPIPTIWALKATTRSKLALTAVFTAGLIVTVVSICRIVSLTYVNFHGNLTRQAIYVDFLALLEVHLSILVISLPMLGPVTKRFLPHRKKAKAPGSGPSYETPRTFGRSNTRMQRHERLDDDEYVMADTQLEQLYNSEANARYQASVGAWESPMQRSSGGSESQLRANAQDSALVHSGQNPNDAIKVERSWIVSSRTGG